MNSWCLVALFLLLTSTRVAVAQGDSDSEFCAGRIGVGSGFIQIPTNYLAYFGANGRMSFQYYEGSGLMEVRFDPSKPAPVTMKRLTYVETRKKPFEVTVYRYDGKRGSFHYAVAERPGRGWLVVVGRTMASILPVFDSYEDADRVLDVCPASN